MHYIGDSYEKWFIKHLNNELEIVEKYYIRVQDKIIATKLVSSKLNETKTRLLYNHHDSMGSVDTVTDENGLILLRYSYSPFGKSKVTFSNLTAEIKAMLKVEFTGHDSIDNGRLINMNGRIYDTVFSRFLSPDPFIQDVYNIQNLNRYSYVLNNPFKFRDPSGYLWGALKPLLKPQVLIAIAVGVATAGVATAILAPALIAGLGVTSALASATITGAVVGSTSAFASTMVMTNGNLQASLQAGLIGGLAGGLSAGIGNVLTNSISTSSSFGKDLLTFSGDKMGSGIANVVQKKNFFSGFEISALSFATASFYKAVVGYEVTVESGGDAIEKTPNSPPVKGANNIGTQGKPLDPNGLFNEGGKISTVLNKIGGLNAVAGMHDTFQINLPGISRDVLNVPGMPLASAITYLGLYNDIQCPLCG